MQCNLMSPEAETTTELAIHVRYQWTVDEMIKGQRWHIRQASRSWLYWGMVIPACLMLVVAGVLLLWQGTEGVLRVMGFFVVFFGMIGLLNRAVIVPWDIRRKFRKNPERDMFVERRITAERVYWQTDLGSGEASWSAFCKIVVTPEGFLLYAQPELFYWLPKHGFLNPSDFEAFAELAAQQATSFRRIGAWDAGKAMEKAACGGVKCTHARRKNLRLRIKNRRFDL